MNLLTASLVLCLLCLTHQALADVKKEVLTSLLKPCRDSTEVSDDDYELALSGKELPETPEGKCFVTCFSTLFKLITDDNKLNKDQFLEYVQLKYKTEDEQYKAAEQVAEACEDVTDEKKCEAGYKIAKCMMEKSEEFGLTMDENEEEK